MSAAWDEAADRLHDQWRDERDEWVIPLNGGPRLVPELCDLCSRDLPTTAPGDVCPSDCPELDPECTVPACSDGSHRTCETEEERGMAEGVARDEAVLERRAEWAEDDRRCGL